MTDPERSLRQLHSDRVDAAIELNRSRRDLDEARERRAVSDDIKRIVAETIRNRAEIERLATSEEKPC